MGFAAQPTDGQAQFPAQLIEVLAAAIPQFDALAVVPDPLVGVQLRGVARQACQLEAGGGPGGEEVLDRPAVVNRRAVPDHQQLPPHLAQQLAEEGDDRRPAERLGLDVGEEPPVGGDGADRGEMIARERDAQDGRLAAWGIRARHEGQQGERRLVYEEKGAPLGLGFARRAGQRSAGHAAISASFRWVARLIGFCTLSPSCRNRRLMWAG